jgi:hypothetical protein
MGPELMIRAYALRSELAESCFALSTHFYPSMLVCRFGAVSERLPSLDLIHASFEREVEVRFTLLVMDERVRTRTRDERLYYNVEHDRSGYPRFETECVTRRG